MYVISFFLSKHFQACRKSKISVSIKRPQFLAGRHSLLLSFEARTWWPRTTCCVSVWTCHSQVWCNFFLKSVKSSSRRGVIQRRIVFISSGVWCCFGCVFLIVAKECSVLVGRVQQSETNVWSWRWRHYISVKIWWHHMQQQHSVMSQETWLFQIITVGTSNQNVFFIIGESVVLFSTGFMRNHKL